MKSMSKIFTILVFGAILLLFGCAGSNVNKSNIVASPEHALNQQISNSQVVANVTASVNDRIASAIPIKCTIEQGGQLPMIVYFNGTHMYRAELSVPAQNGGCSDVVQIANGPNYYIGCANGPITQGSKCNYILSTSSASTYDPYALVNAPGVHCENWIIDPSMFAPAPGANVCNESSLGTQ